MDLKEILAISGKAGLYKMETNRENGLIASPLGENKKSFFSARQYMFTPLENITIYTELDAIELKEIFKRMKGKEDNLIDSKSSSKAIRDYFLDIVPEHDQEKVYVSDIKKIIKWYNILDEHQYISLEEKAEKK